MTILDKITNTIENPYTTGNIESGRNEIPKFLKKFEQNISTNLREIYSLIKISQMKSKIKILNKIDSLFQYIEITKNKIYD